MPLRKRVVRVAGPLLLLTVVLLAAAAWLGLRGLAAERALEYARIDLASARTALLDRQLGLARPAIASAGEQTARARALTSDPVWRLAAVLPYVGSTPAAVRALTGAADDVAREVLPEALAAAEEIDPQTLRTPDGAVDLAVVRAATPSAVRSADAAADVAETLRDPSGAMALPAVVQPRVELLAQVEELSEALSGAARALELAPTLLGETQTRRYLVLVQQTGESRGTGGLIGGYVAIEASGGRLTVLGQGSNSDLRNGRIPVPDGVPLDYVERYEPFGSFDTWQIANLSPDLPVVSRVLEARWVAQGGQPLDGVVMLDAVALAQILAGSGPIELGDGRRLAPEELVDYLAVGQYRDIAPEDGVGFGDQGQRKDQLDEVAAIAAERLSSGGGDTLALLRGLSDAVRSGHLRMASDDPVLAAPLSEAGIDGALPAGETPLAYPVVTNGNGSKLEHFLDRRITYQAGPCDGERRRSTITVELRSDPPEGLPSYVVLKNVPGGRATTSITNVVTLAVYATADARLVRATVDGGGVPPEDLSGPFVAGDLEAGLPVFDVELELPPGQTRTFTLELDEPTVPGQALVPEQPLSRPLEREVDVPACRRRSG